MTAPGRDGTFASGPAVRRRLASTVEARGHSSEACVADRAPVVHLGIALDLALLVPAYAAGCVLLWRRAAWGYVIAAVVLVSGVAHQVGYLVALLTLSWLTYRFVEAPAQALGRRVIRWRSSSPAAGTGRDIPVPG